MLPPLILLHGFTQTRQSWRRTATALGSRYRAITPDLPGHGQAALRTPSVDAVTAYLRALAPQAPFTLAGYSMGGNLVLKAVGELGADAPRELIGTVAVSPPMDLGESADALHHWSNRIYEKRFLNNLLARYKRKVKLYPAVFDAARAERVHSIRDFDEFIRGGLTQERLVALLSGLFGGLALLLAAVASTVSWPTR